MKVLMINGSPHEHGCTYTALCEIADTLRAEGVDSEILQVGPSVVRGCTGCGNCFRTRSRRCIFADDLCNTALDRMAECDALIVGSPVHYASAGGSITSLLDRMFYAGSKDMRGKVGAAIVSARRAGTTAALDQLHKYFYISGMPIAPSQYWPMVHGSTPEQVRQDEEGLQIMRTLGRNVAYMVKAFALAREHGLHAPELEKEKKFTNFIR